MLLYIVFFISGFCSLLYQVVWQRLFGLTCGSDNITAAIVVAAFLFGIGSGNWFAASVCGKVSKRRAFRILALAETGITVFAFFSPLLYYTYLFEFFIRFNATFITTSAVLFLSLLIPTFLMGISMPFLARAVIHDAKTTANLLGGIYAVNIFGAATGAIITSRYLIGSLGMEFSLYFGAVMNLSIALCLWIMKTPNGLSHFPIKGHLSWKALIGIGMIGWLVFPTKNNFPVFHPHMLLPAIFLLISARITCERLLVNGYSVTMILGGVISLILATYSITINSPELFSFFTLTLALSIKNCLTPLSIRYRITLLSAVLLGIAFIFEGRIPYLGGLQAAVALFWLVGIQPVDTKRFLFYFSLMMFVLLAFSNDFSSLFLSIILFMGFIKVQPSTSGSRQGKPIHYYLTIFFIAITIIASAPQSLIMAIVVFMITGMLSLCINSFYKEKNQYGNVNIWAGLVLFSGFLSVALEIIWFRTIYNQYQGSSYIFGPMLGVYLFFDGLGLLIATRFINRIANPHSGFYLSQVIAMATALASYGLLVSSDLTADLSDSPILYCIFLMGIPCIFLGFTFPLAQKAIQDKTDLVGKRVGFILFFNTIGNTIGGFLAGFVLLDHFGTIGSLIILGCIGLAFAIIGGINNSSEKLWFLSGASLLILILLLPSNELLWLKIYFNNYDDEQGYLIVKEDYSGVCLFREWDNRGTIYVSGYRQGDIPFGRNQTISGLLGTAFHPNPERVLCIGLGSASTPYLMGTNKKVREIDIVELVEAELPVLNSVCQKEYARNFKAIFEDNRYRIHIGDGRRFLFNAGKYDIIQADMRTARHSGSGAIYSVEFFKQAAERLNPGGYFIQQIFGGNTLTTMAAAFPYVYIYENFSIGSNSPLNLDKDNFDRFVRGNLIVSLSMDGFEGETISNYIEPLIGHVQFQELQIDMISNRINTDLFPSDEFWLNTPVIPPSISLVNRK